MVGHRMQATAAALACLLLVAAGCGSGGGSGSGNNAGGDSAGDSGGSAGAGEESSGGGALADVDVCSLLPAEAVPEALGEPSIGDGVERPPEPSVVGCTWGDPSATFTSVRLWDPVDEQGFEDTIESYEEQTTIAGRTAHVNGVLRFCDVAVDHTDYWFTLDVTIDEASDQEVDACAAAVELATIASSSLPSDPGS